jgi:N-methylhydantoinase A
VPTIDIVSIGAGGGSIAWVDLGRLRVGPQSAGADPGPACYGRGGVEATVTDANVALGYIDPDYFLGGTIKLDRELARKAVQERVAEPLGMSLQDAAAGIIEIATHHMSDLMRKMTVERGYDPRDFVVYAFGGAGPLHGSAFARELGVREVIFPLGNIASAFSAFGLAVSDVTTVTQLSDLQLAPFDPDRVNANLEQLEQDVRAKLTAENLGTKDVDVQRIFALRYKGQVHEVDTPVGPGTLGPADLDRVIDDFERRYETLYGRGSGFRQAGIELVTYRVMATARVQDAALERQDEGDPDPAQALLGREQLYWHGHGLLETAVYGTALRPGMRFAGPAVVRLEATTGLVHPGEQAVLDGYGNIRISLAGTY